MRIVTAIRYDFKFQIRHGFYYAYAFVTAFYLIALVNVPMGVREWVTTFIIFSDTSILGFFFVGAIVLLEKGQGIIDTLFVTPLRLREYLLSKTLSLTTLALLVSLLIVNVSTPFAGTNLFFVLGVLLSSFLFTLTGIAVAAQSQSLNGYFFRGMGYTILFTLPLLNHFHLIESSLFWIIPTQSVLYLIDSVYLYHAPWKLWLSTGYLLLWTVGAYIFTRSVFYQYVILKTGGYRE